MAWACVVYGHAIFMIVSPGKRNNYLALRLTRYRCNDPYAQAMGEARRWIGKDLPKLSGTESATIGIDIPEYDLRRIMLAAPMWRP